MTDHAYNYADFDLSREGNFVAPFAHDAPKVTARAPDFALEDLASGTPVRLAELWAKNAVVIEFGSFT